MILFWRGTQGSCARAVSFVFGRTAAEMRGWIKFGWKALLHAIQHHLHSKVRLHSGDNINAHVDAVAAKCPLLGEERVWTASDGSKLPLQQSSHRLKQNMNCNGWLSHACVNPVFVFAPDRLIRCSTTNCPGSWRDSI